MKLYKIKHLLTVKFIFNPLTPMPASTSLRLSSTSDVITFDQNWYHLYSISAGGKDLSNDTEIRVEP